MVRLPYEWQAYLRWRSSRLLRPGSQFSIVDIMSNSSLCLKFVFLSFYSVETHPSKVYSLCRKIIWRAYSVPYIYCKKYFSPEVVMAFLINNVFLFLPDNMPSDSDRNGCRSSVTSKAAGSRRIRVRAAGTAARRTGTKYDWQLSHNMIDSCHIIVRYSIQFMMHILDVSKATRYVNPILWSIKMLIICFTVTLYEEISRKIGF